MIDRSRVISELKALGINVKGWGAAEINELPRILVPGEHVTHLVNGWYENGLATIVTTTQRLLLIDKKLFTLVVEDVRYDMIAEVDYNVGILDATVCLNTINKKLAFTSFGQRRLRDLTTYIQHRVMELRQQYQLTQHSEESGQELAHHTIHSFFVPGPAQSRVVPTQVQKAFSPYPNQSLTTKQFAFLPKIPRRIRPTT